MDEQELLRKYVEACASAAAVLNSALEISDALHAHHPPQLTPEIIARLVAETQRRVFYLRQREHYRLS